MQGSNQQDQGSKKHITFAQHPDLDHGCAAVLFHVGFFAFDDSSLLAGAKVFAQTDGTPVWIRYRNAGATIDAVSVGLPELQRDESCSNTSPRITSSSYSAASLPARGHRRVWWEVPPLCACLMSTILICIGNFTDTSAWELLKNARRHNHRIICNCSDGCLVCS